LFSVPQTPNPIRSLPEVYQGVAAMAVLRIDIAGNPKTVPYKSFIDVANNSLAILADLDNRFSRRANGALEWFINDLGRNGSLRLEIYSQVREMKRKELPDVGLEVASSFVRGFGMLEKEGRSPEYLTASGMNRAQKMVNVIGHDGTRALIASLPDEGKEETEITVASARNLMNLLPEASKSLGSVEGTLEAISTHKGLAVVVYESLHGKAVTCVIRNADLRQKVQDSLDKRVLITGIVSRNSKSEARKVIVERLEDFKVFGDDLKILPFRKLGGSDPNFTGDMSTEEFIRSIRG
jgi:hypothetical protein